MPRGTAATPPRDRRIRRVVPAEWATYREIRLEALRADPLAFGSTYAREAEFVPEEWRRRLRSRAGNSRSRTWAAVAGKDQFVGIVAAAEVDGTFHLFAMWVAPEFRGRALGAGLLDAALDWVRERTHDRRVLLDVNPSMAAAMNLYRSRGFRPTGRRSGLGHSGDPPIHELELRLLARSPVRPRRGFEGDAPPIRRRDGSAEK